MLKIAVLDDEYSYVEQIRHITETTMKQLGIEYELKEYTRTRVFLADLKEGDYFDIYLLDIEMPEIDGLEVARRIRKEFWEPVIIYITNYVEYAVQAFEVNAYRYIPKKCLVEKLPLAYHSISLMQDARHDIVYTIITGSRVEKIPLRDIFYLEKRGKNVHIFHTRGESKIRITLQEIVEKLNSKFFVIIDRSYVVNVNYVSALKKQQLELKNGISLPVSKPRFQQVKQAILEMRR